MDFVSTLHSHLPVCYHFCFKGFEFESVSILFKGGEGMEMIFEISGFELVPGMSYTQLLCKRSRIPGEYSPTIVLMRRGKLHFSYDVPNAVQKSCKLRVDESESSVLFNAQPVFGGIEELALTFSISTRENHFSSNSILEIEALSNLILGAEQHITVSIGKAQLTLPLIVDEKDRKIILPEIAPDTYIEFKLPVNLPRAAAFDHKVHKYLCECTTIPALIPFSAIRSKYPYMTKRENASIQVFWICF